MQHNQTKKKKKNKTETKAINTKDSSLTNYLVTFYDYLHSGGYIHLSYLMVETL